ncbi:MAG: choice-of-anchor I family protein [Opitutales bacterium]
MNPALRKITSSLFLFLPVAAQASDGIGQLSRYQAKGAEIFQFHPESQRVYSTASDQVQGVEIIDFSEVAAPKQIALVDFGQAFSGVKLDSVASVAIDPTQRGLGAAALIPEDSNLHPGKVGFFDLQTGAILGHVEVGYHPDSLAFSPDGRYIYVANEGEFASRGPQVPGSISLIDLSALTALSEVATLPAETFDFSSQHLADGVDLSGLRSNQPGAAPGIILEPEYVIGVGDKAYVSIQESNAVGVFDARSKKWVAVHDLLTRTHDIDPSDRDDKAERFETVPEGRLHHIPMPDMIAAYETGGQSYILTANEGDAHPDGRDNSRVGKLGKKGYPALNRTYKRELSELYGPHTFKNAKLGRLEVSVVDGLNEQGEIVQLHTFGSRSFSILNAGTGEIVYDSGSDFEMISARLGGKNYNANQESGDFDSRSDAKGPEPEAVTVGRIDGRAYAFIAMERSGFVFIYDITDPSAARYVSMIDTLGRKGLDVGPEFLQFIPAADSPNGLDILLVGFEVSQTITAYTIAF